MKKYSNLIVFGAMGIVIILAVLAFLQRKKENEIMAPILINEVILPYSDLIMEGNYQEAYNTFTSKDYREEHSFEDFLEGHRQNIEDFGNLQEVRSMSEMFVLQRKERKPWVYKGTFAYICKDKSLRVIFDVIKEDNTWKLYNSYPSFNMSYGNPRARVF